MKTQKEKIINRLNQYGFVSSFWAFHNFILRLSERIRELEEDGLRFNKAYGRALGKKGPDRKNYYYILKKRNTK